MDVIIYHNADCQTSRNTLGLIRNAGLESHVIEYLKTPPTRTLLKQLVERMGVSVRAVVREKGTSFTELGLGDRPQNDEQLLDAMIAHPILINRPIVVSPLGVRLCRPAEVVLDILPASGRPPKQGPDSSGDVATSDIDLLARLYDSFNARDLEEALRTMHPDVVWNNDLEGGYVYGHAGVRDYWTRRWQMIKTAAEPIRYTLGPDGVVVAEVRLTARNLSGSLAYDNVAWHIFQIENGLIAHFEARVGPGD